MEERTVEIPAWLVNKYFGDKVKLDEYTVRRVRVRVPRTLIEDFRLESPKDAENLFAFLRNVCKLESVSNLGHPLGRGTLIFNCGGKRLWVRVHGDWPGTGDNYVAISELP